MVRKANHNWDSHSMLHHAPDGSGLRNRQSLPPLPDRTGPKKEESRPLQFESKTPLSQLAYNPSRPMIAPSGSMASLPSYGSLPEYTPAGQPLQERTPGKRYIKNSNDYSPTRDS